MSDKRAEVQTRVTKFLSRHPAGLTTTDEVGCLGVNTADPQ